MLMSFSGIISTTDLNEFITDVRYCIAQLTNAVRLNKNTGTECSCEAKTLQWLIRCKKTLMTWEQDSSGLSGGYTNWITQAQLNAVISSCKNVCGCTRSIIPDDEAVPTTYVLPFSTNVPDYLAVST